MTNDYDEVLPQGRTSAERAMLEHLRLVTEPDLDAWIELFTPDAVLTFPFAPPDMPKQVQGRAALLAQMRGFPETFDLRPVDLQFIETADPLIAVAEFALVGHARATGKPIEQRAIPVVRVDESGLIRRLDDYWNPLPPIAALSPGA